MSGYVQFTVSNPTKEYEDLCQILFNKSSTDCARYDQTFRSTIAAAKDQGLFAYFSGLMKGASGYTLAEAEKLYGARLRTLQGAGAYLVGTGSCAYADGSKCFTMDSANRPMVFDFVDDGYNLVGAFEMLRKDFGDGTAPNTCYMSAATFGSQDLGLCSTYYSHNLLVAPYTLTVRGVPEYYQKNQLGKLNYPMSSCQ